MENKKQYTYEDYDDTGMTSNIIMYIYDLGNGIHHSVVREGLEQHLAKSSQNQLHYARGVLFGAASGNMNNWHHEIIGLLSFIDGAILATEYIDNLNLRG